MVDEQPTTQNKSGVIRPGDIDIGDIVLTCKNGFKANLKEIIVELNINEDIFSPFIFFISYIDIMDNRSQRKKNIDILIAIAKKFL